MSLAVLCRLQSRCCRVLLCSQLCHPGAGSTPQYSMTSVSCASGEAIWYTIRLTIDPRLRPHRVGRVAANIRNPGKACAALCCNGLRPLLCRTSAPQASRGFSHRSRYNARFR
ncbi:hypothetical protein IG631_22257 [Alternaria alternata]|nr:hypothetical protein IG631_22257 [Alternaria alternata]